MASLASNWLRWVGGAPCFRIYGKGRQEPDWHILDVFATQRRDRSGLWRGWCITWTAEVISVGWSFAETVLREQADNPASREHPVEVIGGRIHDWKRRTEKGASSQASASEVLAHECGHTAQARRLGLAYWPLAGSVTLFREGPHWWNCYENEASEQGQFGGLVNGSVCERLMERLKEK